MEIHRNMCSISFSYVKLYLSQRKKGVSAISKSVRNQYLEFLAETGMTRYEFSKRSGIPESTLWSLGQKEDYDVRESNIRKIAQGMGVPASDLFNDNENTICLEDRSEVFNFYVVDTPNQQGQDAENLGSIFKSLELFLSDAGQVIVGTERETGLEGKASNVIKLTEKRRCLNTINYSKHLELLEELQKTAISWVAFNHKAKNEK